jgi:hypothetical protein
MTWAVKKVLLSVMVVGALTFFTLANTFAVISTQTRNNGSTVASGTLLLGNTVNTGTTCISSASGAATNLNTGCDPLYTASSSTLMYPGHPVYADVTITDSGTIPASNIAFYLGSCSKTASPGVGTVTGAPTSAGSGDPCASTGLQFFVAEATDASFTLSTSKCRYPLSNNSPCTFLASTTSFLVANKFDNTHTQNLGNATQAAGASRYFIVGLQYPANAATTYQGVEGVLKLGWILTQ